MEKFFRNNQRLIFWIITGTLALLVIIFLYSSIGFLTDKISQIFGSNLPEDKETVNFNVNQIKKIR